MPETVTERVEVVSEPLTYDRDAPRSYFKDVADAELLGDMSARSRLDRHVEEMRVEIPKLRREMRAVPRGTEYESRTNPSSISSTFAPPLWLIRDFATAPRPKRVLANLVQRFPLPPGVHSVNLPRLTTGTAAATQQDGTAVPGKDIVDTSAQSIVTTITGQADTSLQVLDQSPPGAHMDADLFQDLAEAYDASLEAQMLVGSGVGETLTGVQNIVPAANQIAYTDSTPTGAELVPFLAEAFAVIGDSRNVPPECYMMRSARWAWFATQTSTGGNPLLLADWGPDGQGIISLRTYWNDAIPATLASNQDIIFCLRPSDMFLFEGEHRTAVMEEPLSGTLGVRFQLRGSAAFIVRYPSGQATVSGTGLVVQSGY